MKEKNNKTNLSRSKNGMNESGTMGVKSIENVSQ